jgi:hypothetical protein
MAYNTYGAPYIASYAEALRRYEDTKPIRGQTARPLGHRRYHMWASIEKQADDIVLMYERAACVIWRAGNEFTVHAPRYYNAYQADKMMGMLPSGCGFDWDKGRLFVRTDQGKNKYHLPRNGSLVFKENGKNFNGVTRYTCVDAAIPVEYKLRRGMQSKLVAEHFTPFLSWVRVVLNETERLSYEDMGPVYEKFVTELGYSEQQIESHRKAVDPLDHTSEYKNSVYRFINQLQRLPFPMDGERYFSRPACEFMFNRLATEDPTHWPDMLMVIRKRAGKYFWGNGKGGFRTTYDNVVDFLKALVSYLFHEKVFDIECLEPGQVPSKRNAHFKNEIVHVF